jgi:hypothetical protein
VSNQRGYVTISMSVTNIGDKAQTFFPQNQKLIDTAGRTFEADTMAAYDFNKDGIIELNPGLGTQIVVPFKAPPGTQFTAVELHGSTLSGERRSAWVRRRRRYPHGRRPFERRAVRVQRRPVHNGIAGSASPRGVPATVP